MTDRLQEIRERHEAIIPGPWDWFGNTATDQVWLATPDRGRLILLTPGLRHEERVFDHDAVASYTVGEARERVIEWCGAHLEGSEAMFREDCCQCDALRDFLRGELDREEGRRDYDTYRESSCRKLHLTRSVQTHTDLRFADSSLEDRRDAHGGMLKSYREIGVRYEVLGYRTQGEMALAEAATGKRELYREDFRGIDNPEAEFIAAAPEDIAWLLERVAQLEDALQEISATGCQDYQRLAADALKAGLE